MRECLCDCHATEECPWCVYYDPHDSACRDDMGDTCDDTVAHAAVGWAIHDWLAALGAFVAGQAEAPCS